LPLGLITRLLVLPVGEGCWLTRASTPVGLMLSTSMPFVPTATYRNLPEGPTARLMGGSGVAKGELGASFREASARVILETVMLLETLLAANRKRVARSMARAIGFAPLTGNGEPGATNVLPSARRMPKAEMVLSSLLAT